MPRVRVGHLVRAYLQVVLIVLILAAGAQLGADPILLLGWGTLAWLLLGRTASAAADRAGAGRPVR